MILKLMLWFLISLTPFVLRGITVVLITPTLQLVLCTPGIVIGGLLDFIASTFSTIAQYIVASVISAFFKFLSTVVRVFFRLIFSAIMGMNMMHLPKEGFGGLSENGNKLVLLAIIMIILWVLS